MESVGMTLPKVGTTVQINIESTFINELAKISNWQSICVPNLSTVLYNR